MSPRSNVANWTRADYERAAQAYLESLPPEHFMEATPQSTQREITLASLAVLKVHRRDVQVCNELLVQYPVNGDVGQVCPDNAVVQRETPLEPMGSFNLPFEEGTILWVLEYVSANNKRKDYVDNFRRYGQEMKVPYYLTFETEAKDLRLHRHNGTDYDLVTPTAEGRLPLPELELEVGLLDGWTRFWYRGELLPLPADLVRQMDELQAKLREAERQAEQERQRAEQERQRAEQERQRAEQERQRAEQAESELERLRTLLAQVQGGQSGLSGSGNP